MQKIKWISDIILPAFWLYFIFAFVPVNNKVKKNIDQKLANVKTPFSIKKSYQNEFLLFLNK